MHDSRTFSSVAFYFVYYNFILKIARKQCIIRTQKRRKNNKSICRLTVLYIYPYSYNDSNIDAPDIWSVSLPDTAFKKLCLSQPSLISKTFCHDTLISWKETELLRGKICPVTVRHSKFILKLSRLVTKATKWILWVKNKGAIQQPQKMMGLKVGTMANRNSQMQTRPLLSIV